ncbi:MAG: biopolymer transporter ExbD [Chitinophagaceae bacterium]|nr:biopolymer transporter ExbD [Chitinophagaceae bacterium]
MPSVKLPKKSTDTDMTPFVDIAFLILSFFIMATKFKPPEPVAVVTPGSVSSVIVKDENSMLITIDKDSKVYININAKKDQNKLTQIIEGINTSRSLGLSPAQIQNFKTTPIIGVPFGSLKTLLNLPADQQATVGQPGIPVLDSINNELIWWVSETKKAFAGEKLLYLIKGDNGSKYPTFEGVVNALRKNDEFKYNLVTSQEGPPEGTDEYKRRAAGGK